MCNTLTNIILQISVHIYVQTILKLQHLIFHGSFLADNVRLWLGTTKKGKNMMLL